MRSLQNYTTGKFFSVVGDFSLIFLFADLEEKNSKSLEKVSKNVYQFKPSQDLRLQLLFLTKLTC